MLRFMTCNILLKTLIEADRTKSSIIDVLTLLNMSKFIFSERLDSRNDYLFRNYKIGKFCCLSNRVVFKNI